VLHAQHVSDHHVTSRKLLSSGDAAWLLILEHVSGSLTENIDESKLDEILRSLTSANSQLEVQEEPDDGHDDHDHGAEEEEEDHDGHDHDVEDESLHVDEHDSSSLPHVVTSQYLLTEYGSNGTLSQQQFQSASLEIIHCLMDANCTLTTPLDEQHDLHDHGDEDAASDGLKLILATVIFAWAVFGGMMPLVLRRINLQVYTKYLGVMNSFAGGVFLATAFTHLLPHAIEEAVAFDTGRFPMEYFLIMMGYFLILLFERVLFADHHDHHDAEQPSSTNNPEAKHDVESPGNGPVAWMGVSMWDIRMELIALACVSLHSLLAGITLGMQDDEEGATLLFWTIFSHKSVMAFSLASKFMRAGVSKSQFVFLTIVFSLVTPVGALMGIAMKNSSAEMEATFNCISTGAFIYMGTIHVVLDEMTSNVTDAASISQKRSLKFVAMMIGVLTISLLGMTVGGHNHDHGH